MANHSKRAHAVLSASGASRWMNCTPSAQLEAKYGVKTNSEYAAEGTLAHELAELLLQSFLKKQKPSAQAIAAIENNSLYTPDMPDYVAQYVEYCQGEYTELLNRYPLDTDMRIEAKLDLSRYVPESFGTADCIVVGGDTMEVIDLKYGKGVVVYADDNPQLKLYALGAYDLLGMVYDIQTVKLTIVQPRLDNISSWEIPLVDLLDWAENELREKAYMAHRGEGEPTIGAWCKFCSVKARCTALYQESLDVAESDFGDDPRIMTDEQVSDILSRSDTILDFLSAVKDYALAQALEGKSWPDFKLVEGRSVRKFGADDSVIAAVLEESFPDVPREEFYTSKIKGITDLEKLLGKKKFTEMLGDYIVKPEGKPTLVSASDKRPAINPLEQARLDFQ